MHAHIPNFNWVSDACVPRLILLRETCAVNAAPHLILLREKDQVNAAHPKYALNAAHCMHTFNAAHHP
jgi:hypothetical protein